MKKPQCHSLRTVPGRSDVFFCAHPQLHASEHRVTLGICKSCRLRTEPAPDNFRGFTLWRDNLCHRAEMQLVVARYRENLDWLERFRGIPTVAYDKGDLRAENPLPNVGREAHTYLHHIVAHYDSLAPVTVFLQGDPYAHIPNLDEKIWSLPSNVGFQALCDYILVEDGRGHPVHPGLQLTNLYEDLFEEPSPDFFLCHSAACFAVSRENVRRRPRAF
ncbi:MAG: DUF3431 domain-containing protein [Thermoguttaceae bacterium]